MPVYCTQYEEGISLGEREILPPLAGETSAQILERKAKSHAARGWEVEWTGSASFIASKRYHENELVVGEPFHRERHFILRGE